MLYIIFWLHVSRETCCDLSYWVVDMTLIANTTFGLEPNHKPGSHIVFFGKQVMTYENACSVVIKRQNLSTYLLYSIG